ncbi:MAG TPA: hypothetical protein VFY36_11035 [Solirubrobacteraceae bacterium]|nr:hypothetical protein [Solirubrobacteraceae bacterium]
MPPTIESIATPTRPAAGVLAGCAGCGSPLASDQRYCLECGERCSPHGGAPLADPHSAELHTQAPPSAPPSTPPQPPRIPPVERAAQQSSAATVIAGIGVLLLAMGVGVLIGRSGNPTQAAQPTPQVITLTAPAGSQQSPEANATPSARHAPKAAKHSSGSRVGSSVKHPAPASVLDGLKGAKGKSYAEKSKNLPDVVSTG